MIDCALESSDGKRKPEIYGNRYSTEQLESELAVAWARQAELHARLSTLQELEEGFDHYPQGVRTIMANPAATEGVCGVVAQVVEVPQAYERAVAAVLREKPEYIVVSQVEDGLNAVAYLHDAGAGRGSFIPLHPRVDKGAVYTNGNSNGHTGSHAHLFGAEGFSRC